MMNNEMEQAREAGLADFRTWTGVDDTTAPAWAVGFDAGYKAADSVMPKWTYCEDAMPPYDGWYDVTFAPNLDHAVTGRVRFLDGQWTVVGVKGPLQVIAWQPLPKAAVQRDITGGGKHEHD